MSDLREQNKVLVRRWIAECNRRNFGAMEELFAPDYVLHHPGRDVEGLENARQHLARFCEAFPDLTIAIEDLIADDDKVVVRLKLRGTHQGELLGIPPTARRVEIGVVTITRVEGDKVAEQWEVYDSLDLLRQLGAGPEHAAAARIVGPAGPSPRQTGAVA